MGSKASSVVRRVWRRARTLAAPWRLIVRAREAGWISSFLLMAAVAVPIVAYSVASHEFSVDRIERIEYSERTKDLAAVARRLEEEAQHLLTGVVEDHAIRTECYNAVARRDHEWLDENIMDWVPERFGVDAVYIVSPAGETISKRGKHKALDAEPLKVDPAAAALEGQGVRGLLDSPDGTYIVAASPILRNDRSGPPVGVLIAAQLIDSEHLQALAATVGTDVLFFRRGDLAARAGGYCGPASLHDPGGTFAMLSGGEAQHFELSSDKHTAFMCRAVKDVSGTAVGMIAIAAPRTDLLASQGALATSSLLLIILCVGVAATLVRGAYQRAVRKMPMRRLAAAIRDMAESGHFQQLNHHETRDETGDLFSAVNDLTEGWVRTKRELLMRTQIDGLTGLYNHRHLQDRLQQEIERAQRYRRDLSLLFLDIDCFKAVNDTYGHQAGDEVLKRVADCTKANLRTGDTIARYGGEEFAIILPETELAEAVKVAEKIRRNVEETPILVSIPAPPEDTHAQAVTLAVTVSIGAADFPACSADRDGLIMAADLAMLLAKSESRNAVRAYSAVASGCSLGGANPIFLHRFLRDGILSAVRALAGAIDARDHHTRGHSERVAAFAASLAEAAGLGEHEISVLRVAALLHDVGKLGVPDRVLLEKDDFISEEKEVMETHSVIGYEILSKIPQLAEIATVVRHHHERYDGTGYPTGRSGKIIPLLSRILCIADAYEAMRSERAYRRAKDKEGAIAELESGASTQFDPELVQIFVDLVRRGLPGEEATEEQKKAA